MRNLKLTIAYDGTDFHGWQIQPNLRTVQGELQQAFQKLFNHDVSISGSGRTDAGVHAEGHGLAAADADCEGPENGPRRGRPVGAPCRGVWFEC